MHFTGPILKKLRISKRLKQADIASMLNISIPAYSKIEMGKTDINIKRLYQLTEIFEVSPYELITKDKNVPQSASVNELELLKTKVHERNNEIIKLQVTLIDLYERAEEKKKTDL